MLPADDMDDLSFTELLNMDLDAPDGTVPPVAASEPEQLPGVSSVTRPRSSRRGGPGTAPQGAGPAYRLVPPLQPDGGTPQVPACSCELQLLHPCLLRTICILSIASSA